ncbi:MAG TPA: nicotinate-nucleotide adenylyltransferase [Thermomicrobiales bacterium]|nr:nicotinate-nucleotide adenylyltransferase [Thermomicrobiales bacterium]
MTMPASQQRIGVLGGTFDPPHLGHLIIATEFQYALRLDRVLWVPAGRPPHKTNLPISSDEDRLAMVRLTIAGASGFAVSTIDIDRGGVSYTADLLEILRGEHPGGRLFFLMGEDSLRDLPTWHDPNRICRAAAIGVARRPGIDIDLAAILAAVPDCRGQMHFVSPPDIGISSTEVRRRVRDGEPIAYQVPAAVERYIYERGLYRRAT